MKMKKTLTLILALVLIASLTIGGTLAYFSWTSGEVTNNFTVVGDGIDVVNPTKPDPEDPDGPEIPILEPNWEDDAEIIPGNVYAKDPQVMLGDKSSVDVWVIFSVEEVRNEIAGKKIVLWEKSDDVVDVTAALQAKTGATDTLYFAAKVTKGTADNIQLFKGGDVDAEGQVTINPELTDADLDALAETLKTNDEDATNDLTVQLVVNAWVIQALSEDVAADWAAVMA